MSGGSHRPDGAPASGEGPTVAEIVERAAQERRSGEQPAARPARPARPLPPAPYGAVPPPLAAPSASALAGHPTTADPAAPQQRPQRRPEPHPDHRTDHRAADGPPRRPEGASGPGTRYSPLGAALAPPTPAPRPAAPVAPPPVVPPVVPPPPVAGPGTRSGEQVSFRARFVPGPDDTQVIPVLPPVPTRVDEDEDTGTVVAREGTPGGSRGILRAAGTMAVASLVSRITGLLRTVVITAALGVAAVNDAYNTANTLPNIVYELLLGGVLTSVSSRCWCTRRNGTATAGSATPSG